MLASRRYRSWAPSATRSARSRARRSVRCPRACSGSGSWPTATGRSRCARSNVCSPSYFPLAFPLPGFLAAVRLMSAAFTVACRQGQRWVFPQAAAPNGPAVAFVAGSTAGHWFDSCASTLIWHHRHGCGKGGHAIALGGPPTRPGGRGAVCRALSEPPDNREASGCRPGDLLVPALHPLHHPPLLLHRVQLSGQGVTLKSPAIPAVPVSRYNNRVGRKGRSGSCPVVG